MKVAEFLERIKSTWHGHEVEVEIEFAPGRIVRTSIERIDLVELGYTGQGSRSHLVLRTPRFQQRDGDPA